MEVENSACVHEAESQKEREAGSDTTSVRFLAETVGSQQWALELIQLLPDDELHDDDDVMT